MYCAAWHRLRVLLLCVVLARLVLLLMLSRLMVSN